jgi:hypothetical protein
MSENLDQIRNLMNTPELCKLILEQFKRACRPDRCTKYVEPKEDGPDVKRKNNLCDHEKCETKKTYLILLQRKKEIKEANKEIKKEEENIEKSKKRKTLIKEINYL